VRTTISRKLGFLFTWQWLHPWIFGYRRKYFKPRWLRSFMHSFSTIFMSSTTRFVTVGVHHRRFSHERWLGAWGSCPSLPTTYYILHNDVGSQPDALVCATTVGIALHSTIRNCSIPCLHCRCIVSSDNEHKVDALSIWDVFNYFGIVLSYVNGFLHSRESSFL